MNMDDALNTFIIEARELLEQMENGLLRIEKSPEDEDTINAIFRAVHTIKGSSGLFGFDHVVEFTHVAESVLDRVRCGEIHITTDLVALFLKVCDQLGELINQIADKTNPDDGTRNACDELVKKLRLFLADLHTNQLANTTAMHSGKVEEEASENLDTDNWQISLRFGPNVLRNGMDPLSFINYLTTFGKIVHIATLIDAVPTLSELDPEANYLGFEISFHCDASKATIEGAFDFVRDEAIIHILPPNSRISEYLHLIADLPEEELRLGEILVRCGTLTQTQLDLALCNQAFKINEPIKPLGEVLVEQKLVQPQVVTAALDKQKQIKEIKNTDSGLIRVNAENLDQHINLIGELIIASAGASLIAQRTAMPALLETAAILSRLVEEVRDSALNLRMVQIGATFNRFQRVVRDVSAELGKDIRLEIDGAETDLDKTVVEKIGDPLTHLVRNSMDHGIEMAELRLSRGKPAHGTVKLSAYHDSGSIIIEVSDDGGGLNRSRILKKAIDRGLVKADQKLSDSDICNLIFVPGFSTVEQVSNLSGRGVGMDVVKRNITALRGTVEIESTEGVGTTIRIRLPLTLAIIDGFLVGVNGSTFVVPLDMVVECVELSQQETASSQGCDHLNLRGEMLPFIRLKQLFDIPIPPTATFCQQAEDSLDCGNTLSNYGSSETILTAEGKAALANDPELAFLLHPVSRENIVVVQYAGHQAGLVVDELLGEFQTVIRPLGLVFTGLDGISGFTILGNGNVSLILDVSGLVRRITHREIRRNTNAMAYALPE
jgi:two-component system chemotaxis sensor kinase CheA